MPLASDHCICLRKTEYSETSQILTLLSRRQGIVRVVAKGAHRRTKAGASRFDGGIDILDLGHAVFSGDTSRELSILTDWKLQDGNLSLRKNLRALYLAIYAAELLGLVLEEHDPHPEVFDLIHRLLPELSTAAVEESFLAFELDLLREAGFMPQLAACVGCTSRVGDRDGISFSPARGGILCGNCPASTTATASDRIPLDVRLLRLMQMIQSPAPRRLPRLTRHQTDPINRLLLQHIEHCLGRRPRSAYYILAQILPRPSPVRPLPQFACNSTGPGA
jgi:DNA repair protein RecO (recombination protein O)